MVVSVKDIGEDDRLVPAGDHWPQSAVCTTTGKHELLRTIEKLNSVKEYAMVAFLDIEGAFNNIQPNSITAALWSLAVIELIWMMLTGRRITAEFGGTSTTRYVNRGTPQGGVLSPLLWNLALNPALLSLGRSGLDVVAYADDVAIVVGGKYPPTLTREVSQRLHSDLSEFLICCRT